MSGLAAQEHADMAGMGFLRGAPNPSRGHSPSRWFAPQEGRGAIGQGAGRRAHDHRVMIKRPTQEPTASDLGVRERVLLFCVASGTDWQRAGVTGEM